MSEQKTAGLHPGRNVERLEHDREVYEQLKLDGFRGPQLVQLQEDLWLYGWRVLRSWMKDGTIIERCGENRIVVPAWYTEVETMRRMAELRDELAAESIAPAVTYFTQTLLPNGGWDPDKGASMRTYFLRSCLYYFRDAFKSWARKHRQQLAMISDWTLSDDRPSSEMSTERRVALRSDISDILAHEKWEVRAICALIYKTGRTYTEIGVDLQMSARSVEGHMRRLRARARQLRASERRVG
ncbi:hypothetical protein [Streptomyces bacillaris]|uniref:hypothetical protein n=1 Tax=Streptomyces bacillaris TaxID=68179 RepID=UPI003EBC938C